MYGADNAINCPDIVYNYKGNQGFQSYYRVSFIAIPVYSFVSQLRANKTLFHYSITAALTKGSTIGVEEEITGLQFNCFSSYRPVELMWFQQFV